MSKPGSLAGCSLQAAEEDGGWDSNDMDRLGGAREGRCTHWVHMARRVVDLRGEISESGGIGATERVRRWWALLTHAGSPGTSLIGRGAFVSKDPITLARAGWLLAPTNLPSGRWALNGYFLLLH